METKDARLSQSRDRGARLRSGAKLLRIGSTVVAFVSMLIFLLMAGVLDDAVFLGMAVALVGTAVAGMAIAGFVAADRLEKTARRHLALSASQAMTQDPRPPVLYLRSFSDEPHTQRVRLSRRFWERDVAEEELLAFEVAKVGPFVAVGRPGDHLPQVGANRLYVDDADWASVVLGLMDKAAGVVIRIGPGGGLAWEIQQAVLRLSLNDLPSSSPTTCRRTTSSSGRPTRSCHNPCPGTRMGPGCHRLLRASTCWDTCTLRPTGRHSWSCFCSALPDLARRRPFAERSQVAWLRSSRGSWWLLHLVAREHRNG